MPFDTPDGFCAEISASPSGISVTFPGGLVLTSLPQVKIPTGLDQTKAMLAQVNTVLAPLSPIFTMMEAIIDLFQFAKAASTLSVGDMVEKLKDLAKNADKLLGMVPQLATPILIANTIDVVLVFIDGILDQLSSIVAAQTRIALAATRASALNLPELTAVVDCATLSIDAQISSLTTTMQPVNQLFTILNVLISFIPGVPAFPSISDLGADAQGAIDKLRAAFDLVKNIRDLIPIPSQLPE